MKRERPLNEKILRDIQRFIRFNTVSSRSNILFAAEVGRMLKHRGFRVQYQKTILHGKPYANVLGSKGPVESKRPLLLSAHMDTVPPGDPKKWTHTGENPWHATPSGDWVYGLGSADDKASLLAALTAGANVEESKLTSPVVVAATFGEESGMHGVKFLIEKWRGPKPFLALVGEPTALDVTYRHKGLGVIAIDIECPNPHARAAFEREIHLEFKGKQAHSSRPWLGDNALVKAVERLRHDNTRRPGLRIRKIRAGQAPNLIPDHAGLTVLRPSPGHRGAACGFPVEHLLIVYDAVREILRTSTPKKDISFRPDTLTSNFAIARTHAHTLSLVFDFRLLPGQSVDRIAADLRKLLTARLKGPSNACFHLRIERNNPPLGGRLHDTPVLSIKKILRENGFAPQFITKPSCTEAGTFSEWGIPSLVVGPGEAAGNIHSPDERVSLNQILEGIRLYESVIRAYCMRKTA